MKSFAMKEMWKFSQFQLKEMFGYGKKKAFIQLLFLRSFSICVFCALVSGESLKECLSLIEQLLILLSYYFRFLSVRLNRLKNRLLANYLRNRGNDLATVRNSAFCVAILSNNSFICKYNIFFRKYELSVAIL